MAGVGFFPPVVAQLLADTGEFTAKMGEARGEMVATAKSGQGAFTGLASLGKAALIGLGIAAVAVSAESVKMASDFQSAMEKVHTQAGASQSEVDALGKKVLALAPTVGIGPETLADGLYHVESAGFRGAQAMDILTAAAKGAAVGGANLEDVTQAMIGVMASGISGVSNANDAMAILNQTVGIGDMRMEGLAKAIGSGILPSAKNFGLSMQDVSAALATVTDNATPPDEAATRLRMTFSLLAVQTPAAAKALAQIGISSGQLGADMRKPNGLLVAIDDLKTHLQSSGKTAVEQGQIISEAFGGGKSAGTIETLLGESDRLKSKYEELGTSSSRSQKFQDAWAKTQKTFSQEMKQLEATVQSLGIRLGTVLIPKLEAVAKWVASVVQWFQKHKTVAEAVAVAIVSVLVVAIAAYTVSMASAAVATIAATWPILLIIAAVALLAVGIYELVTHWSTVWGAIKTAALAVWHALETAWSATWNAIKAVGMWIWNNIFKPIGQFFGTYVVAPIHAGLTVLGRIWDIMWRGLMVPVKIVQGFMSVVIADVVKGINMVLTPVIQTFEKGWSIAWSGISSAAKWVWDNVLVYIWDGLKIAYGWIQDGIKLVEKGWSIAWSGISSAAKWVWDNILSPIWTGLKIAYGWVLDGINLVEKGWSKAWSAITGVISTVWNNTLGPIFSAIKSAVETVISDIQTVVNAPSKFGSGIAHLLGFDDGGWVPGPAGAPMPILAHGGEFVLSRDMLAQMQLGTAPSGAGSLPMPLPTSGAGGGVTTLQPLTVVATMEGQPLFQTTVMLAQRHLGRNTSTMLAGRPT